MLGLQRLKTVLDIGSGIAVLFVASLIGWQFFNPPTSSAISRGPVETVLDTIDGAALTNRQGNAKTILVEFADFQCPFCGRHAAETFPKIKRELIDSGKISYAFMNFPLEAIHAEAFKASEAAECAGQQGKYWNMHERLFAHQSALSLSQLIEHANAIAVDHDKFESCLIKGETASKVRADMDYGKRLRVEGTPSFFVGTIERDGGVQLRRRIRGLVSVETLKQTVDEVAKPTRWFPQLFGLFTAK